jgi:hypothetical protein
MTTQERLAQAEADLDTLIHRAQCTLPTLRRLAEDVGDWRKDIRAELYANLLKATEDARANQSKRRSEPSQMS